METASASSASGYSDSDSETESSLYSPNRINNFGGYDSSWRALTEQDRAVANSIARLRNQDLSIHLYNAHAMKRRCYDLKSYSKLVPWASKDRWRLVGHQDYDTNDSQFVPPKIWTAWPLNPSSVPRSGEQVGEEDGSEVHTFKRRKVARPSDELVESMVAATLRIAKDRFDSREWDDSADQDKGGQLDKKQSEQTTFPQDHAASELHRLQGMGDFPDYGRQEESDSGQSAIELAKVVKSASDSSETGSSAQGTREPKRPKSQSKPLPVELSALQRLVVSADDERSRILLEPSIRHKISELDKLLQALHHARKTCHHNNSDDGSSEDYSIKGSGDESDAAKSVGSAAGNGKSLVKRAVGRPRKTFDLSEIQTQYASQIESNSDGQPTRSKRGRKRQVYSQLEGESREEMLIRIARKQKKPLPFTSISPQRQKLDSSNNSCSKQEKEARVTESKQTMRLGVRDWSEILGTAALSGFPLDVIRRATQRCATLFGEGIDLRSLVENPIPGKTEDEVVRYEPEKVPYLGEIENNTDLSTENAITTVRLSGDGLYLCPFNDCVQFKTGFERKDNLRRHLRQTHKLNDEGVNRAMGHSDDEMDGAVHVDGFMRSMKKRVGRGKDRSVSKKRARNRSQRRQRAGSEESNNEASMGSTDDMGTTSKE